MKNGKWLLMLLLSGALSLKAQTREDGLKAIDSENYASARRIFSQLIRQNSTDPLNYYYLGTVYSTLGKIDSSRIIFNLGSQADPKSIYNFVGIGRTYLEQNNVQKATEYFDKAKSLTTQKDVNLYLIMADAYSSAEHPHYDQAVTLLNKAIELTNKNPEVYWVLGKTYEAMPNKSGDAVTAYERATELNPSYAKAFTRIGVIWRNARRGELSSESFEKALAADPNFPPAYRELAELYHATGKDGKATETYEKYRALADKDDDTEFRYAQFLFLIQKYQDALNILNSLKGKIDKPVYWRLLAYANYETGNYSESLQNINDFLKKADAQKILASDYEYLGKAQIKTGDSTGIVNLEKAISLDSTKAELYNEIAKMEYDKKRYHEAAVYYSKRISALPKTAALVDHFNVGRSYYLAKEYSFADSAFIEVIKWNPTWPIGYLWRARSNSGMDSQNPDSVKGLAAPYYQMVIEKADTAITKYRKELVEAYQYLGNINALRENYGASLYYYDKAMAVNPAAPEIAEIKETYAAVKERYKQTPDGSVSATKTEAGLTIPVMINGNNFNAFYDPGFAGIGVNQEGLTQLFGGGSENGSKSVVIKIGERSLKNVPVILNTELKQSIVIGADVLNKMNIVFDYAGTSLLLR